MKKQLKKHKNFFIKPNTALFQNIIKFLNNHTNIKKQINNVVKNKK